MYQVKFHKRTLKQLSKLTKKERDKVLAEIKLLSQDIFNERLNIKPYHNSEKSWRLRIGGLRAIYTYDIKKKVLYIEYLGYRGSIYKM